MSGLFRHIFKCLINIWSSFGVYSTDTTLCTSIKLHQIAMVLLILGRARSSHDSNFEENKETSTLDAMHVATSFTMLLEGDWIWRGWSCSGTQRRMNSSYFQNTLVYLAMSVFFAKSLMLTITGLVKVTFKLLYRYQLVDAIYLCTIVNCPSQLKQNKKPECISKYFKQTSSRIF